MRVKLVRDCRAVLGILPKGMRGTIIGERSHIIKVGNTTTRADECFILFRDVIASGGGGPHDIRRWVPKDAVKKLAPWDYLF